MNVTIAEEVLLLALGEEDGRQLIPSMQLDSALGGAILAELAVKERLTLTGKKVTVVNSAPLGDDELDAVLTRIAGDGKERRPEWWVQKLYSGKLRKRLLERLAARGTLTEQRAKVLGLFPTTRWPEADGSVEAEVRARVAAALAGSDPDAATAVLVAVLHAAKLDRKAFPGADPKRVKEIAEGQWAGDAVAKLISTINSAIMVAVTTAAVGAATSSTGS
ncbi:GOLPH3/VPS74 family protein [Nonomuraea typhae]|uniref:GOLPH3/VPS74 family protein n=1 Tax=Nonomuraea typhae TaxID=2603600 RepID=UPI0012F86710|nr:GPP34 family phosphoprotein [Nonomuraea typhae]